MSGFTNYATRVELAVHYRLAAELLNNASDGWWDDVGDLNGTIVIHPADTECTPATGMIQFFNQSAQFDLVGVLGPMCSGASAAVSTLTGMLRDGMPVISPSATAITLKDKSSFPYFMRTTPHDGFQTVLLADIAEQYGWHFIASLWLDDDVYAEGVASGFNDTFLARSGNRIVYGSAFDADDADGISSKLSNIQEAGAKVLLISARADSAYAVLRQAIDDGVMLGNGQTWLAVDGWSYSGVFLDDDDNVDVEAVNASRGFIGLRPLTNTSAPLYEDYISLWGSLPADKYPGDDDSRTTLDTYATHAVDAVVAYAYAMRQVIDTEGVNAIWDGDTLLNALYDVEFDGVSGPLNFTNSGERKTDYGLVNAGGTTAEWRSVGYVDIDTSEIVVTDTITSPVHGRDGVVSDTYDARVVVILADRGSSPAEEIGVFQLMFSLLNDTDDGAYDHVAPITLQWYPEYHNVNCTSESASALLETLEDTLENATFVLAPFCSTGTTPFAEAAQSLDVPVIAFGSTSDSLTDVPFFVRTIAADVEQAALLAETLEKAGWEHINVLYADTDVYSSNLFEQLQVAAPNVAVAQEISVSLTDSTKSIEQALEKIDEKSESYIVVLLALGALADKVLGVAEDKNLLTGDDGYVWVGADSWMNTAVSSKYAKFVHGAVGTAPFVDTTTDEYKEFLQFWVAWNDTVQDVDGNFSTLSLYSPMAADSVLTAAHAMDTLIRANLDINNGSLFHKEIVGTATTESLAFDGVSGAVEFRDDGDRTPSLALYNLREDGSVKQIGTHTSAGTTVDLTLAIWPDGTSEIPDEEKEVESSSNGNASFRVLQIAVVLVVLVLIASVVGYIGYSQQHEAHSRAARHHGKAVPRHSISTAMQRVSHMIDQSADGDNDEKVRRSSSRKHVIDAHTHEQVHGKRLGGTVDTGAGAADLAQIRDAGAVTGELEEDEEIDDPRIVAAGLHCLSALVGLPTEPDRKIQRHTFELFRFYFSALYQDYIFSGMTLIHLGLAWWEQTSSHDNSTKPSANVNVLLLSVEFIIVTFYVADVWVQWLLFPRSTFTKKKNILYLVVILLLTVDGFVHFLGLSNIVRFSRPLRASVTVLHSRSMESDLRKLASSALRVADVAIVTTGIIVFLAGGSVILYGPDVYQHCSIAQDGDAVSLRNFGDAFVSFVITMKGDNYPTIAHNPYACTTDSASLAFAAVTTLLFILVGIMLASLFDSWAVARAGQVARFLEREHANLKLAYNTLVADTGDPGVSREDWCALLRLLQGRHVPYEFTDESFTLIDKNQNGYLDLKEFVHVSPILLQDVELISDAWLEHHGNPNDSDPSAPTPASEGSTSSSSNDSWHKRWKGKHARANGVPPTSRSYSGDSESNADPDSATSADEEPKAFFPSTGHEHQRLGGKSLWTRMQLKLHARLRRAFPGTEDPKKRDLAFNNLWLIGLSLLCIVGNTALMVQYTASNRERWAFFNAIDDGFMIVSLLGTMFRIKMLGWRNYSHRSYCKVDLALTLVSSIGVGIFEVLGTFGFATMLRFVRLLRVFLMVDMLAKHWGWDVRVKTRRVFVRLYTAGPVLLRMIMLVFVLMYFWAIIGMELWSGKLATCNARTEVCTALADGYATPELNFNSLGRAMNFLFTLTLDADISNVLQTTKSISGSTAVIYWICLYLSLVLLLVNVFYAVVIDTYAHLHAVSKKRSKFHKTTSAGMIRVKPSKLHKRYRVDLDVEESRRAAEEEAVVQRHLMDRIKEQVEQRMDRHATLIETSLALTSARHRQNLSHVDESQMTHGAKLWHRARARLHHAQSDEEAPGNGAAAETKSGRPQDQISSTEAAAAPSMPRPQRAPRLSAVFGTVPPISQTADRTTAHRAAVELVPPANGSPQAQQTPTINNAGTNVNAETTDMGTHMVVQHHDDIELETHL